MTEQTRHSIEWYMEQHTRDRRRIANLRRGIRQLQKLFKYYQDNYMSKLERIRICEREISRLTAELIKLTPPASLNAKENKDRPWWYIWR